MTSFSFRLNPSDVWSSSIATEAPFQDWYSTRSGTRSLSGKKLGKTLLSHQKTVGILVSCLLVNSISSVFPFLLDTWPQSHHVSPPRTRSCLTRNSSSSFGVYPCGQRVFCHVTGIQDRDTCLAQVSHGCADFARIRRREAAFLTAFGISFFLVIN